MFSKKLSADGFTNLISPRTTVNGTVTYDGVLKVQGKITGEVIDYQRDAEVSKREATIIIDAGGEVQSDKVTAISAIIKGRLACKTLTVEQTLRVHAEARVDCVTIYYRTLEIEPGAELHDCRLIHLDRAGEGEQGRA